MSKLSIFLFLGLILFIFPKTEAQNITETGSGIKTTVNTIDVEIRFYNPEIVRIIKSPVNISFEKKSLSVIMDPGKVPVEVTSDNQSVTVNSDKVKVSLDTQTGKISFSTPDGQKLLNEKDYGIQFTPTMDVNTPDFLARQAFLLDRDEAIYGLGQQQNNKLIQRDERIILQNENMKICIPYFLSTKGYGIFWDNYAPTTYTDNAQETSFESLGHSADYYFMYGGNGQGVIAQMRTLTGQAPMMPLWSYGYFQSRERYKTQQELTGVVEKYRSLHVPLDGIIQDWQYWGRDSMWNAMSFDPENYPDPQGMVDQVHQMNAS